MFGACFYYPPPPTPQAWKESTRGWPNSIYWCVPSFHFLVIEWKTQIMCLIDQREHISFVGINNSLQLTEPKEPRLFELYDWSCPEKTAGHWVLCTGACVASAGLFCSIIASNLYLKLISVHAAWPRAKGTEPIWYTARVSFRFLPVMWIKMWKITIPSHFSPVSIFSFETVIIRFFFSPQQDDLYYVFPVFKT